jgi:putative SOS response-associated peptidase YedK
MCGRYSLTKKEMRIVWRLPPGELQLYFKERFNIAPTQDAPLILFQDGQTLQRQMRWGLQPSWANYPIINVKSETLTTKPTFRESFSSRRCLALADGFYEWQKPAKTPFRFVLPDRSAFCFAALWDHSFIKSAGQRLETFAIITTAASADVLPVHERMPLIIPPQDYENWLSNPTQAAQMLKTPHPLKLDCYPVNSIVNKAANEDPRCIQPADKTLI